VSVLLIPLPYHIGQHYIVSSSLDHLRICYADLWHGNAALWPENAFYDSNHRHAFKLWTFITEPEYDVVHYRVGATWYRIRMWPWY
jgi:hypothetical protein